MKHTWKITAIILAMFLITQFIGLGVVKLYQSGKQLPYGMAVPEASSELAFTEYFGSILFAFLIAIALFFLLKKFKFEFVMKLWFFVVVVLSLAITFNSFIPLGSSALIAILIALPLAIFKIFKGNFLIHNLTELFIYPGIAAIFVPILTIWTVTLLLIVISVYDIWAVWHSGIMQKMAKYQINKLKVFSGFFVPYISKSVKIKIKKMKKSKLKRKKIRINLAILGGGDIVFPIITSGVIMKFWGFLPALFVIAGATLGLSYLLFFSEKKKPYPAMPFISAGIFLGMILFFLIFYL